MYGSHGFAFVPSITSPDYLLQIQILISDIIHHTKTMGGVHIADHYGATYSFTRQTEKWRRKLFFGGLEVAVVNSNAIYKENITNAGIEPKKHQNFWKELVKQLIQQKRDSSHKRPCVTQNSNFGEIG